MTRTNYRDPVAMAARFAYFNDREPSPEELDGYMADYLADMADEARGRATEMES